jgi:hypothetical protein
VQHSRKSHGNGCDQSSRRHRLFYEAIMFGPKVKLAPDLYERLTKTSAAAGYSTVDEFITHVLEKAAAETENVESEAEVRKRLQGLGYID